MYLLLLIASDATVGHNVSLIMICVYSIAAFHHDVDSSCYLCDSNEVPVQRDKRENVFTLKFFPN